MTDIMDFKGGTRGTRSFFFEGLQGKGKTPSRVIRKIGMLTTNCEAALIERTALGKKLTYGVAVFNGTIKALQDVIDPLDECIAAANGVSTRP